VLLSLALGVALSATVALAGTAQQAEAALTEKIAFSSNRTTGMGVDNPTGDYEVFTMNPDGTGLTQLTFNQVNDNGPTLSPDGTKIAYESEQSQDAIFVMSALDGSGNKNLTNGTNQSYYPIFSPDGTKIAYTSQGDEISNPQRDYEVYAMNATDGSGKVNLTDNGGGVTDYPSDFSPDGTRVVYESQGAQTSNPQGDWEVYRVNALDGSANTNLTNNGSGVDDFAGALSPDGTRIAYTSSGIQTSNAQGDQEVYRMNATDGTGKTNLSNNRSRVYDGNPDFSPDGTRVAYQSSGKQTSNRQGDYEVYRMSATDGSGKLNLTNNRRGVNDHTPDFSPDGTRIAYQSNGAQTSNPEGDWEVYRVNASDGTAKKNLTNNAANDFSPDWGVQAM